MEYYIRKNKPSKLSRFLEKTHKFAVFTIFLGSSVGFVYLFGVAIKYYTKVKPVQLASAKLYLEAIDLKKKIEEQAEL